MRFFHRFRHGRTTEQLYRARCDCGWFGPWMDSEWDATDAWHQHLKEVA